VAARRGAGHLVRAVRPAGGERPPTPRRDGAACARGRDRCRRRAPARGARRRRGAAGADAAADGPGATSGLGHAVRGRGRTCALGHCGGAAVVGRAGLLPLRPRGALQHQAEYGLGWLQGPADRDLRSGPRAAAPPGELRGPCWDGGHAQAARRCGLRRCRYIGLAKARLQHVLTAAAVNLVGVAEWFAGTPVAKTRWSRSPRSSPLPDPPANSPPVSLFGTGLEALLQCAFWCPRLHPCPIRRPPRCRVSPHVPLLPPALR
jgi:hypothetical protein